MIVFMQKASEVGRKMNGLFVNRNMFVFTCYVTLIITVMYRRLVVM